MKLSPLLAVAVALAGCAHEGADGDRAASEGLGKADDWSAPGDAPAELLAPEWLLSVDGSGSWTDEADEAEGREVVRAWVDARVANLRYDERVFVEVHAPYVGGAAMRVLHHAEYRRPLDDGDEQWGTDEIELYPAGGPHGAELNGPVLFRLRLQHDQGGDGQDEMVLTEWHRLYGDGEPAPPEGDPWLPSELASPVHVTGDAGEPPEVYFSPFDDPGRRVVDEIDAVIDAELASPGERHTIHAAVFNIIDPEIVDRLIAAHQAGVEVRLVFDGRKHRPWYDWYDGDDRLLAAGVPLLGVRRPGTGAMHDKIALFDGRLVATGSANWEAGSRFDNHENMVVSRDTSLVAAYGRRFEAVAGGVLRPRAFAADAAARLSVSFAPDEAPYRIVGRLIDEAVETVHVAMFTAKDVEWEEEGRRTSLLQKLVDARRRGVEVILIVDHGIHEASEYHGVVTEDDPSDEWVEAEGVHVVRADNPFGRYASMHHKFVVVDGEVVVTGAFNWYHDAAFSNDEDQLVIRDADVAARFSGELVDLLRRYDPDYSPDEWPTAHLEVEAHHGGTRWGDQLVLVGDLPELGAWDPRRALPLSAESWPTWTGSVELPRGVRAECKLAVLHEDGAITWEHGDDRILTTPPVDADPIRLDFRQ